MDGRAQLEPCHEDALLGPALVPGDLGEGMPAVGPVAQEQVGVGHGARPDFGGLAAGRVGALWEVALRPDDLPPGQERPGHELLRQAVAQGLDAGQRVAREPQLSELLPHRGAEVQAVGRRGRSLP